jgi:hypothetical protein
MPLPLPCIVTCLLLCLSSWPLVPLGCAVREHFAVLTDRREKAAAEKLQLEHKLKLQRLEMAKQIGCLQVGI